MLYTSRLKEKLIWNFNLSMRIYPVIWKGISKKYNIRQHFLLPFILSEKYAPRNSLITYWWNTYSHRNYRQLVVLLSANNWCLRYFICTVYCTNFFPKTSFLFLFVAIKIIECSSSLRKAAVYDEHHLFWWAPNFITKHGLWKCLLL